MSISKKFGIYSREGAHPVAKAFSEGLSAIGHAPRHRSHSDYRPGEVERFDAVVVFGLRGKGAVIADEYRTAGIPVIVVDFGYVNRVNGPGDELMGHWQIGVDGLNKLPPFECPPDRFEALGVAIQPAVEREGPAVLCVQRIGDLAHPFDTPAKLQKWVDSMPHDEVRGHPLDADVEDLAAMLGRVRKLITWNSNIGHDALLAGVPVQATGDAIYRDVAMDERAAYFARVAYGQWTADEMRKGLPQSFLIEHLLPNMPLQIDKFPRQGGPTLGAAATTRQRRNAR